MGTNWTRARVEVCAGRAGAVGTGDEGAGVIELPAVPAHVSKPPPRAVAHVAPPHALAGAAVLARGGRAALCQRRGGDSCQKEQASLQRLETQSKGGRYRKYSTTNKRSARLR